jgi:hypothetical protein
MAGAVPKLKSARRCCRRFERSSGDTDPTRERVVAIINPILRGWVNYFAIGHSSRSFQFVQRWVELKIRRHMMRARSRQGFGWERWHTRRLYDTLGLFNGYRVRLDLRIALSARYV